MRQRAFTLVELLVVIAIIAILAAILYPVFAQVRSAAYQYNASNAAGQLSRAAILYVSDNEDSFMLATYVEGNSAQAWFGRRDMAFPFFDGTQGLLYPYMKRIVKDPRGSNFAEYLGDHSGFGYNWGYIGSDFNVRGDMTGFPNCTNAAHLTELARPADTIVFGTSAYFYAPWMPHGDGKTYDFGFIDPPRFWAGNPDLDFRHIGTKKVDASAKRVTSDGNAVVAFADSHVRSIRMTAVTDTMFERGQVPENSGNRMPGGVGDN